METPNEVMMRVLRIALSAKRPHDSFADGALVLTLAMTFKDWYPSIPVHVDGAGNLHVDLRDRYCGTLFVAHVDTACATEGPIAIDDSTPVWRSDGATILGADDGAGVALLAALIRAGLPAYYVFTRGEECGGLGAQHLADSHVSLLSQFDRAIAFDRRGSSSVITHQAGGRCCSDVFAEALSDQLNAAGMLMMPDPTGVYTDTAEFTELIPECTNISAGYQHEHSVRETLDTEHLQQLLVAVLQVDWDDLPTERDPTEIEDDWCGFVSRRGRSARLKYDDDGFQADPFDGLSEYEKRTFVDRVNRAANTIDPDDPFAFSEDGRVLRVGYHS